MDKVDKHKESGLPKPYVGKLSASTAKARKAHWKKMSKYSDRDPRAYEPAPGDARAKTRPSKATIEVRKMMKEQEVEIPDAVNKKLKKFVGQLDKSVKTHAKQRDVLKSLSKKDKKDEVNEADSSLSAKAKKTGISLSTLKTVYKRGVAAWNSGHRPGTTPQQWGHARVNAYIRKGKGTYHGADKDLREMAEAKDSREYGYEGEMVMSQLKGIMMHADKMHGMLKPDTDLPEWVQSKITLAYDYLQTATDYMSTELSEARAPGKPSIKRYTRSDGTTALKSLSKWGQRKDWRDTEGGLAKAKAHAKVDKVDEEMGAAGGVPTNNMSSGAVADPKNKKLFGKPIKRFKPFTTGK